MTNNKKDYFPSSFDKRLSTKNGNIPLWDKAVVQDILNEKDRDTKFEKLNQYAEDCIGKELLEELYTHYSKKVSSVRSLIGTKDNLFQRRHYEFLAKAIGEFDTPNHSNLTDYMIKHFSDLLAQDNPRFDTKRFREKVNFIKEGKWPDLYG